MFECGTWALTNTQKWGRARSNVHEALYPTANRRYIGMPSAVNLKKYFWGPFCCVCTSCNKFESAPMTALQSSYVCGADQVVAELRLTATQCSWAGEHSPQPEAVPTLQNKATFKLKFPGENEMLLLKTTPW